LAEAVAVNHDIAVNPVLIRAAGHGARRVVGERPLDPELNREVGRADVGGRTRQVVRRVVDANLNAVDVADAVAVEA
jgi:hypothetical protein